MFTVFGGGDVTQRLIRPAALELGLTLDVYDITSVPDGTVYDGNVSDIPLSPVVVIATPTETHIDMVSALSGMRCRVACEKPLTLTPEGMSALDSSPHLFDGVFVLSYYALEKTLPLTFLLTRRDVYSDFLHISDGDVEEIHSSLGCVSSVTFSFREPAEGEVSSLRDVEDLVFHVFMLISQLSSSSEVRLRDVNATFSSGQGVGLLRVDGEVYSPESGFIFSADIERGGDVKCRVATVLFDNGWVEVDCDSRSVQVFDTQGEALWQSEVLDSLLSYQIQLLLVSRWVHFGGSPRSYDLFGDAVSASRLWLECKRYCFPEA